MASKEYFVWTPEAKYRLAYVTNKHGAHKKTELNMKDKWKNVVNELKPDFLVLGLDISAEALKNTYKRHVGAVLSELGISNDAVNLSGLPECTEYQKLIMDMTKEVWLQQKAAADATNKKTKVREGVLKHERAGLEAQGAAFTPQVKIENGENQESTGSSVTTNSSPRGGSWFDLQRRMIDLTESEEDVELDREEKRQKLKHEAEEHEMRMAERQASLDMQKALIAMLTK